MTETGNRRRDNVSK